jgi:N-acetylmuramoyl-L-alanine amidase
MIKPAYNRIFGAALGATLVLYPTIQPMLNPTGSNPYDTQHLPSSADTMALDTLPLKKLFALEFEDHTRHHDAPTELLRKEISPESLVEGEKALVRQQITGPTHPVYRLPAGRQRMSDRSNAVPLNEARITNIESSSGPNYGSVIIDLSRATSYVAQRADKNQIVIRMTEAAISPSLDQRVFTLGESGLIKQIVLSCGTNQDAARSAGASVAIDVALNSDYSVLRLSDPPRIVIQLRSQVSQSTSPSPDKKVATAISSVVSQSAAGETAGSIQEEQLSTDSQDEFVVDEKRLVSWRLENRIGTPYQIENAISPALSTIPDITINRPIPDINNLSRAIEPKPPDSLIKCIVIDAGHGGHDPGAISPNGIFEKEIVFDIAQRLKAYIRTRYPHIEVVLTRESDHFITVDERIAIANRRGADLFLSIRRRDLLLEPEWRIVTTSFPCK